MAQLQSAKHGFEPKRFDPTTKTSEKLLSFGWANDITSAAATLRFKAYDKIQTTALYYNHSHKASALAKDEWLLYSHSVPVTASNTTPNFYSISIGYLRPLTHYSFVIECVYTTKQVTHSNPIKFRTKNRSIDLGETGLK